jgi:hypothetical protein
MRQDVRSRTEMFLRRKTKPKVASAVKAVIGGYIPLAQKGAANGVATLNVSSKVVQDPANATATPAANKIVMAGASGKAAVGWLPITTLTTGALAVSTVYTLAHGLGARYSIRQTSTTAQTTGVS